MNNNLANPSLADTSPLNRNGITGAIPTIVLSLVLTACGAAGVSEQGASASTGGTSSGTGPGPGPVSGSSATLTWNPNGESDLAGYRVYYGTSPNSYDQPKGAGVVVGNATRYVVSGLSGGTRYYFSVTAYDFSGNESDYSTEMFKDIP